MQAEAQELRQELKASDEMVNTLKVELAQMRITQSSQWQRGMGPAGGHHLPHEDVPIESSSSQVGCQLCLIAMTQFCAWQCLSSGLSHEGDSVGTTPSPYLGQPVWL